MALRALLVALFAMGLFVRVAPLLEGGDATVPDGRLLSQWPTEDGYFMLTMGRNVGLGNGLSVAGGEMPTNGTQPLTTFVWALLYALVGGDRLLGVLFAQLLQLLAAGGTAYLLNRLGQRALAGRPDAKQTSAIAAGFWFASPVAMPHTMNCLETGFYALVATGVAFAFLAERDRLWSWKRTLGFGALLGLCFWVRNDAAFLIAAACLTYLLPAFREPAERKGRLARVLTFGATSVVVASPWLIFNVVEFGHLMPVSGRAEALTGDFGGNLGGVPIVLAEYLMTVVPIPHAISDRPWMIAIATAIVVTAAGWVVAKRDTLPPAARTLAIVVGLYLGAMVAFYGLYFGAAWFLPRYFLPASPFLALLFAVVVCRVAAWARERGGLKQLVPVGAVLTVALMGALHVRHWRGGADHPHFQVVRWIHENVPEETWVGAIQTGTLGFFHDKTINLDGKVNIAAYEALLAGNEGEYVVERTPIVYLADWTGMRDWLTKPAIAAHFEVVAYDEEANLAVLRRRGPPPRSGL